MGKNGVSPLTRSKAGHSELCARLLTDPAISQNALREMGVAMANFTAGRVGGPMDIAVLEALADQTDHRDKVPQTARGAC